MTTCARQEADVVVVGGGGAGLAAAIEASATGQRVLLLEKNEELGGTTRLSVGSVSASGTPHQRRLGIHDSAAEFAEDTARLNETRGLGGRDNVEFRRFLTEESSRTFSWLLDMGLEFFGPMPEPPNRAPRMHNVLPNATAYIYTLARRARRQGVEVMLGMAAERLLSAAGRVTGVQARSTSGDLLEINARRGVVLATGDYSSSPELKKQFMAAGVAEVEGINPTSTGDGHRMALAVGARVVNGDLALGPEIRFVAPPRKRLIAALPPMKPLARVMNVVATHLPARLLRPIFMSFLTTNLAPSRGLFAEGALLINRHGQRFVNELDHPAIAIPRQPDRVAFIVFDNRLAQRFSEWPYFISTAPGIAYAYLADYRRNRRDVYAQAPTIAALAARLGMPGAALETTVARYNRFANEGKDPVFGRDPLGPGLQEPPYYALGPAKGWLAATDGGLAVTSRMEVLDQNEQVIPGLYAAGSAGQGGVLLEAHGMHLCWAFASGRLAGRTAAGG